jgi:hypothetical protein
MKRRRAGDIFGMLLEPRVPVLFLLGSLVLAVLGNAVYDLILAFTGDGVIALFWVSFGSLGLLLAIFGGLWLFFNARRPRAQVEVQPGRLLSDGYAGLILFVSERADAAEEAAITHHLSQKTLRHIWFIVSPEARENATRIAKWLDEQPNGDQVRVTELPIDDAFEVSIAYQAVQNALQLAETLIDQVIVDMTTGTKFMSVGAVLACRDYGVPMEYVRVPYRDGKPETDAPWKIVKVTL